MRTYDCDHKQPKLDVGEMSMEEIERYHIWLHTEKNNCFNCWKAEQ